MTAHVTAGRTPADLQCQEATMSRRAKPREDAPRNGNGRRAKPAPAPPAKQTPKGKAPKGRAAKSGPPKESALERRSRGPLMMLHKVPPAVILILVATLGFVGLLLEGLVGGVLLLVLALFLLWLLAVGWSAMGTGGRFLRLIIVAVVAAVGINAIINR